MHLWSSSTSNEITLPVISSQSAVFLGSQQTMMQARLHEDKAQVLRFERHLAIEAANTSAGVVSSSKSANSHQAAYNWNGTRGTFAVSRTGHKRRQNPNGSGEWNASSKRHSGQKKYLQPINGGGASNYAPSRNSSSISTTAERQKPHNAASGQTHRSALSSTHSSAKSHQFPPSSNATLDNVIFSVYHLIDSPMDSIQPSKRLAARKKSQKGGFIVIQDENALLASRDDENYTNQLRRLSHQFNNGVTIYNHSNAGIATQDLRRNASHIRRSKYSNGRRVSTELIDTGNVLGSQPALEVQTNPPSILRPNRARASKCSSNTVTSPLNQAPSQKKRHHKASAAPRKPPKPNSRTLTVGHKKPKRTLDPMQQQQHQIKIELPRSHRHFPEHAGNNHQASSSNSRLSSRSNTSFTAPLSPHHSFELSKTTIVRSDSSYGQASLSGARPSDIERESCTSHSRSISKQSDETRFIVKTEFIDSPPSAEYIKKPNTHHSMRTRITLCDNQVEMMRYKPSTGNSPSRKRKSTHHASGTSQTSSSSPRHVSNIAVPQLNIQQHVPKVDSQVGEYPKSGHSSERKTPRSSAIMIDSISYNDSTLPPAASLEFTKMPPSTFASLSSAFPIHSRPPITHRFQREIVSKRRPSKKSEPIIDDDFGAWKISRVSPNDLLGKRPARKVESGMWRVDESKGSARV